MRSPSAQGALHTHSIDRKSGVPESTPVGCVRDEDPQWAAVSMCGTGHLSGRRVHVELSQVLLSGGSLALCRGKVWLLPEPLPLLALAGPANRLRPSLLSLAELHVMTHRP